MEDLFTGLPTAQGAVVLRDPSLPEPKRKKRRKAKGPDGTAPVQEGEAVDKAPVHACYGLQDNQEAGETREGGAVSRGAFNDDPTGDGREDDEAAEEVGAVEKVDGGKTEGDRTAQEEEEASLPLWMRAAHARVIKPHTPSLGALGLDGRLVRTLAAQGLGHAFPVQATVVPIVLAAHASRCNRDLCVCAPTGSGKTLA